MAARLTRQTKEIFEKHILERNHLKYRTWVRIPASPKNYMEKDDGRIKNENHIDSQKGQVAPKKYLKNPITSLIKGTARYPRKFCF